MPECISSLIQQKKLSYDEDSSSLSNRWIYYTRTIVKLKKAAHSTPFQLYFTVHIDKSGNDLNTYNSPYTGGTYILAYGINGYHNDVPSAVYDYHESFEILSDKLKMLVPLDMNGQQITNCPNITPQVNFIHGSLLTSRGNVFSLFGSQQNCF